MAGKETGVQMKVSLAAGLVALTLLLPSGKSFAVITATNLGYTGSTNGVVNRCVCSIETTTWYCGKGYTCSGGNPGGIHGHYCASPGGMLTAPIKWTK